MALATTTIDNTKTSKNHASFHLASEENKQLLGATRKLKLKMVK